MSLNDDSAIPSKQKACHTTGFVKMVITHDL